MGGFAGEMQGEKPSWKTDEGEHLYLQTQAPGCASFCLYANANMRLGQRRFLTSRTEEVTSICYQICTDETDVSVVQKYPRPMGFTHDGY